MKIQLAGMANDSIVDGPGLRLTVFVQGCKRKCEGCHNTHTWPLNGGYEEDTENIIQKLHRNPLLQGLTLSGGEPFLQSQPCSELAQAAHQMGLSVWAYTGFTWEDLTWDLYNYSFLKEVDVLVDGPFILSQRTLELPWRGSKNQRLIDVPKSLKEWQVILWSD